MVGGEPAEHALATSATLRKWRMPSAGSSDPTRMAPDERRAVWRGRCLAAAAALLWSTSGFFVKAPWFDDWPSDRRALLLAFWRALFAGLTLLPWVRRPRFSLGLLPMAGSFALMTCTYLIALVAGSAALAIWLQQLAPLWVLIAAYLLYGAQPTRADLILVAGCVAGVLVILSGALSDGNASVVALGLISGIAYAGVILSLRQLRGYDAVWLVVVSQSVCVAVLLPYVLWHQPPIHPGQWAALLALGALQIGLPYVLFARALRILPAHEGALLGLLEPLLVQFWVWVAWGADPAYQPVPWTVWLGGASILIALCVRYRGEAIGVRK
jgi:drug/metabolite transporter (DMT)-like permease